MRNKGVNSNRKSFRRQGEKKNKSIVPQSIMSNKIEDMPYSLASDCHPGVQDQDVKYATGQQQVISNQLTVMECESFCNRERTRIRAGFTWYLPSTR